MISKERKHELAVLIGKKNAENEIKLTTQFVVYKVIKQFDDFSYLPDEEVLQIADELASLIRTGQVIIDFPQLYVGQGDGEPVGAPDDENEA